MTEVYDYIESTHGNSIDLSFQCEKIISFHIDLKETTLVMKILGKKTILNMGIMSTIWELDGDIITRDLGDGFYTLSFFSKHDFFKVWSKGVITMENQCILLRRWSPDFEVDIKNMSFTQIWMTLPDLDIVYWKYEFLSLIASAAGEVIAIDIYSDEARVCVEVDVNHPLVTGVQVDDGYEGFWQNFLYEIPGFCFDCGRIGHKREHCPHLNEEEKVVTYGSHNLASVRDEDRRHNSVRYFSWHRPPLGWVKLNFDGSFKGKTGRAGAGGLLRDENGEFIGGFIARVEASSSLIAEITALHDGLKLALKLGVDCILIEGDSKITIQLLSGQRKAKGEEENLLMADIFNLITGFKDVLTRHEFREANRSADHLANMAVEVDDYKEGHAQPPYSLLPFLYDDKLNRVVPRFFL